MCPAGRFDDPGWRARCLHAVEVVEAGIAVGMENAAELREVLPRVLALPIRAVEVAGRRWRRVAPGPAIADVSPEPSCLRLSPSRVEHGHRRVITMEAARREDMGPQRLDQRVHQCGRASHPVGHGGAGDLHALARVDLRLPVERKVVAVLRHQHMGDQAGPGLAPLDRETGHVRLDAGVTGPAGEARPDMAHDAERGRHVVEHLVRHCA